MGALRYLFSFKGRINRAKLWLFVLISFVVGIALVFFDPESAKDLGNASLVPVIAKLGPQAEFAMAAGVLVVNLVLFWASIALTVKRLHDRNKGAAWLLVFYGIPFVCICAIVAVVGFGYFTAHGHKPSIEPWMFAPLIGAFLAFFVVGIWGFVEFYCLRGSHSENRFGVDPLGGPPYCSPDKPAEGCIPRPAD